MMLEELLFLVGSLKRYIELTHMDYVLCMTGLVGGSIWHTIGGARNAPKGQRIVQAISRTKARVPIVGGIRT
jgi:hypothetical protein